MMLLAENQPRDFPLVNNCRMRAHDSPLCINAEKPIFLDTSEEVIAFFFLGDFEQDCSGAL